MFRLSDRNPTSPLLRRFPICKLATIPSYDTNQQLPHSHSTVTTAAAKTRKRTKASLPGADGCHRGFRNQGRNHGVTSGRPGAQQVNGKCRLHL